MGGLSIYLISIVHTFDFTYPQNQKLLHTYFSLVLVFNCHNILMSRRAPNKFYCSGSIREFLSKLVQNLTLRNDCNLNTGPSICPLKAIVGQGFHFTDFSYLKVHSKEV